MAAFILIGCRNRENKENRTRIKSKTRYRKVKISEKEEIEIITESKFDALETDGK